MIKLIKYLKPFLIPVFAIIILLLVQAACDLSLPDYNSHIVNVGIQQGGIENAVPKAIRKSELDKLVLFMNAEEKAKISENYTLLEKYRLSQTDYETYENLYPRLAEEPVYILHSVSKNEITELNSIMGKNILILSEIGKSGLDPSKIPISQLQAIRTAADRKIAGLSESMINQTAVSYLQKEYAALGVNTNQMQSNYILYTGGIMVMIALLSMAASVTVGYLAARVAAGLGRLLRKEVFRKVTGFSNSEFDKFSTASLITRSTNDIQQIQMLLVMLLRIIFYAPILGIGGVIKVYQDNSSMWWIIALALLAILLLVISLFGVAIPRFKRVQKLIDRLNLVTREILTGIPVIRAFSTQKHEEEKFDQANRDLTSTNLFVTRVMAVMMPVMLLVMNGTTLLIIWVGGHQVDQGVMQVGNMMAFIQYSMQIIMAFLMISMVSIMLPRASVAAQRIGEVLDTEFQSRIPGMRGHSTKR